ncbi:phosphopentomutase [Dongia deserti]|uniref:phosphopentomutase n=1 Tax=Dongia deserti TaxID=2268030 RepID=UPI000E659A64|nr:phosphopentomutase [Dongia deserti]
MQRRAIILVLDSFGIGATADAAQFGDAGADTLGHIAQACADGRADKPGVRSGRLRVPNLARWGLGRAAEISTGAIPPGLEADGIEGAYGCAAEVSKGKDTPSGHWEMAGCPMPFDWGYFPRERPCFPREIIEQLVGEFRLPAILGDCHASGTEIIVELGEEHIRTGKPICYTSADSVFQVAAHEQHFGLERLYRFCERAKELLVPLNIGRVIARPFVGESPADFRRTANRRDYTTPPPEETLLDRVSASGAEVWSIGKIADIFANRGISKKLKAEDNVGLFDRTIDAMTEAGDRSLVFANFVDFDMLYGHRRDVVGYAAALEAFDRRLPELEARLRPGDLVLATADHGCDPTWSGTDHTREHVPVLFFGPAVPAGSVGKRLSFADMGQTIARHLNLAPLAHGQNCFA